MRRSFWVFAVILLVALPFSAAASGSGSLWLGVEAQSSLGSASQWFLYEASVGGLYDWSLTNKLTLTGSGGQVIGEITGLYLDVNTDPWIALDFTVLAGAEDTTFTIGSILAYSNIPWADAYATASITATDRNRNGAVLTGEFDGGKAYQALYNNSTEFASLISTPINAPVRGSNTGSENTGVSYLYNAMNMAAIYNFTLSANDSASGTSFYELTPVPEPGGAMAMLVGIAGLAGFAVRRRK